MGNLSKILKALMPLLLVSSFSPAQITLAFPASHRLVTISLPDKPAALQMDLLHLKTERNTLTADGLSRSLSAHDGSWTVTVNLSPSIGRNAESLRDQTRRGLTSEASQERSFELGQSRVLDYMVLRSGGKDVHQKNSVVFLVSGDQLFAVHISKVLFDPSDEKYLNSILSSLKLIEKYQPDPRVEFEYGSFFYSEKDWLRSSQHYEKALDIGLRQKKRALTPTEWRVLVNNLGLAYGMLHDLEKAKQTFQFGITQDPAYPMFHYNLARTYAELNDLDGALADLKSAFAYRRNGIPGEAIPDPRKDPAFGSLLGDARFVKLTFQVCPESQLTTTGFRCQ